MQRGPALTALVLVLLTAVVWETAVGTGVVPDYVLPAPSQIVRTVELNFGIIIRNTLITAQEIVFGLLAAVLLMAFSAVPLGYSRQSRNLVIPPLIALQAVPLIAIAPLLVFWLGVGLISKSAMSAVLAFIPMTIRVSQGLWSLDQETESFLRSVSRSRMTLLMYVRIPAAMPAFLDSLRLAIPGAIIGALVGEFIGSDGGIGYLILASVGQLDLPLAFALLLIVMFTGIMVHPIVHILERMLLKWAAIK